MSLHAKSWSPLHRNLICLVKKSPIATANIPHTTRRTRMPDVEEAWRDISKKLSLSTRKCKLQWTRIKMRYAKIMNLINTGKITMESAIANPQTSKFFDGFISFLDPYITYITDDDIPYLIHKSINDIFGLKTNNRTENPVENNPRFITHGEVKALLAERRLRGDVVNNIDKEYLQTIVDMAVEQKLEELLKDASSKPNNNEDENTMVSNTVKKGNERNPSHTLISSINNPNSNEENINKSINLGLQSELILDDDIKTEEDDITSEDEDLVKDDYATLKKNVNNTTETNYDLDITAGHNTHNTLSELHENVTVIQDNINDMTGTPPVTNEYIRNFFNELGEIMSTELSLDKQKILKSRINELLKSMFLE
ncbi:hypothetical protein PYW07_000915 [Mythimna separata]|uniref:MADF domain-containing protein n=1 Tax=Mythimna separata TaxID=271217 RepID=A0AAD7YS24_MYTSE|nr:hypothetical protein PYW07_000915 [Mythimna separata]